ncbi:MAG: hypothetical protein RMJ39_08180 [Deltaproteobacteria bacterium]|nr:hypothetical protein [Deltaproteobacteria bacterium]
MAGPQRLSAELTLEEVDLHRYFDCKHYRRCLVFAAVMKWVSFSCKDCKNFLRSKKGYMGKCSISERLGS